MNWLIFAIATWVMFALEWGFRDALQLGDTGIAPTFPIMMVVFVAMRGPGRTALAAAAVVGVVYDVMYSVALRGGGEVVVIGPHALGCMFAAYAVIVARSLMYRRSILAVIALSVIAAGLMGVVVMALHMVRSLYDVIEPGRAVSQLGRTTGSALFTGVAAVVIGPMLTALRGLFQFAEPARSSLRS